MPLLNEHTRFPLFLVMCLIEFSELLDSLTKNYFPGEIWIMLSNNNTSVIISPSTSLSDWKETKGSMCRPGSLPALPGLCHVISLGLLLAALQQQCDHLLKPKDAYLSQALRNYRVCRSGLGCRLHGAIKCPDPCPLAHSSLADAQGNGQFGSRIPAGRGRIQNRKS